MKAYLTTILLGTAIFLIAFGIHITNTILICIGGALVGAYNGMIYNKIKEE